MRSAQQIAPFLNEGDVEFDMPSLNPFQVKNFVVSPKSSGLLIKLQDMHMYNMHNYTVLNAR